MAASCTYQLLSSPSCSTRAIQKSLTFHEISGEREEKNQKNGPSGEKWPDRKSKRTRQKNKRGDRKEESNDSPEVPDKGRGEETLNIPGLPSGVQGLHRHYHHTFWWNHAEWN